MTVESVAVLSPPARRTLTGARSVDLLLAGGLSIVVWAGLMLASLAGVEPPDAGIAYTVALGVLFVNNPHFMASYGLAYRRGLPFLRAHRGPLVLAPLALVAVVAAGWLARGIPAVRIPGAATLNSILAGLHIAGRIGNQGDVGHEALCALTHTMLMLVGWHYAKQAFGAFMVFAQFDGVKITPRTRSTLRAHVLAWWALSFIGINTMPSAGDNGPLLVPRIGFPPGLIFVPLAAVVVTGGLWIAALVAQSRGGQRPTAGMILPVLALYTWLVPPPVLGQVAFVALTPLFHSLQYLPFVAKAGGAREVPIRVSVRNAVGLVVAGLAAFILVPRGLDRALGSAGFGLAYWVVALPTLINVHHYFIDSVIWKLGDAEVRKRLLA